MHAFARAVVAGTLALLAAQPARAAVQVSMTVEGPRGPFATGDFARPSALRLTSVQADFGPASAGPLVAPPPVVVTRLADGLSSQFLGAAASRDVLRVVITVLQTPSPADAPPPGDDGGSDAARRHRRILTLTNARVLSVHAGMVATDGASQALGVETIAFTYERLEVIDDGAKVFASGR